MAPSVLRYSPDSTVISTGFCPVVGSHPSTVTENVAPRRNLPQKAKRHRYLADAGALPEFRQLDENVTWYGA